MMIRKLLATGDLARHRTALLAVAVAALLVASLAVTGPPASASSARSAKSIFCGYPVLLGVHGIGEGPSTDTSQNNISPELGDFEGALSAIQDPAQYGTEYGLVGYPTVEPSGWDVEGVFNQGPLLTNVKQGVASLQLAELAHRVGVARQ